MIQGHLQNQQIEPIHWPAPVIRLELRWDGRSWLIAGEQRVKSMTLPAPASLPDGDNSRGFWVETVDRQGRVRHRDIMADPLMGMEQFGPNGDIKRLDHPPHDVLIEVLIPDLPELAEVHAVSNPIAHRGDHDQRPSRTRLSIKGRSPNDTDDNSGDTSSSNRDDMKPDDDHPNGHEHSDPDRGKRGRPS